MDDKDFCKKFDVTPTEGEMRLVNKLPSEHRDGGLSLSDVQEWKNSLPSADPADVDAYLNQYVKDEKTAQFYKICPNQAIFDWAAKLFKQRELVKSEKEGFLDLGEQKVFPHNFDLTQAAQSAFAEAQKLYDSEKFAEAAKVLQASPLMEKQKKAWVSFLNKAQERADQGLPVIKTYERFFRDSPGDEIRKFSELIGLRNEAGEDYFQFPYDRQPKKYLADNPPIQDLSVLYQLDSDHLNLSTVMSLKDPLERARAHRLFSAIQWSHAQPNRYIIPLEYRIIVADPKQFAENSELLNILGTDEFLESVRKSQADVEAYLKLKVPENYSIWITYLPGKKADQRSNATNVKWMVFHHGRIVFDLEGDYKNHLEMKQTLRHEFAHLATPNLCYGDLDSRFLCEGVAQLAETFGGSSHRYDSDFRFRYEKSPGSHWQWEDGHTAYALGLRVVENLIGDLGEREFLRMIREIEGKPAFFMHSYNRFIKEIIKETTGKELEQWLEDTNLTMGPSDLRQSMKKPFGIGPSRIKRDIWNVGLGTTYHFLEHIPDQRFPFDVSFGDLGGFQVKAQGSYGLELDRELYFYPGINLIYRQVFRALPSADVSGTLHTGALQVLAGIQHDSWKWGWGSLLNFLPSAEVYLGLNFTDGNMIDQQGRPLVLSDFGLDAGLTLRPIVVNLGEANEYHLGSNVNLNYQYTPSLGGLLGLGLGVYSAFDIW